MEFGSYGWYCFFCGWNILTKLDNFFVLKWAIGYVVKAYGVKGTSSRADVESNIKFWRWHMMGFVEVSTNRKVTYGILLKPWLNIYQTNLITHIIYKKKYNIYFLPPFIHFLSPLSRLEERSDLMRMTKYYVVLFESLPFFLLASIESSFDMSPCHVGIGSLTLRTNTSFTLAP